MVYVHVYTQLSRDNRPVRPSAHRLLNVCRPGASQTNSSSAYLYGQGYCDAMGSSNIRLELKSHADGRIRGQTWEKGEGVMMSSPLEGVANRMVKF